MDYRIVLESITNQNKLEKYIEAVSQLAKALELPVTVKPIHEENKEKFPFKSQEQLTNRWLPFFGRITDELYFALCRYLELPIVTTFSKAVGDKPLIFRGKVMYSPETGKPLRAKDWDNLIQAIEKFLNRKLKDVEKKIVLDSQVLGRIISRISKYNTQEAVQALKLEEAKYEKYSWDDLSESLKVYKEKFNPSDEELFRLWLAEESLGNHITHIRQDTSIKIKEVFIEGWKQKKNKRQIAQDLFDKFGSLNKDWERIVEFETNNTFNNALVQEEMVTKKPEEKVYLRRQEMGDEFTCRHCVRITGLLVLVVDEPLEDERIDDKYAKIAIWEGKSNIGRPQKNWWVAAGAQHPYCFDDLTEVLTNEGWKLFQNVKDSDLIMAINPETKEIDFVPFIKRIVYHRSDKMIHFKGRNYDLMVTPNHNMLYTTRKLDKKNQMAEIKAEDLIKKSNYLLPRAVGYWQARNTIKEIDFGGKKISIETWVKFWAWFLSEGSVRKRKTNWGYYVYEVKIAQSNPIKVLEDLKEIKDFFSIYKESICTYDKYIGKMVLGIMDKKSFEKYVPSFIKEYSPELIRLFLETYIKGDGSWITYQRKQNISYNPYRNEKVIYTSSKRMADDITELVLKAGWIPSIYTNKTKGKGTQHRNGYYYSNHDIYFISILKSKYRHFRKRFTRGMAGDLYKPIIIDYDGMVYDLELEKWHHLCVRRNGKVAWSGNCRGSWYQEYPEAGEELGYDFEAVYAKRDKEDKVWGETLEEVLDTGAKQDEPDFLDKVKKIFQQKMKGGK